MVGSGYLTRFKLIIGQIVEEDINCPGPLCDYPCPLDCTSINNGECNSMNGTCKCLIKWTGEGCSVPNQFVTSLIPNYSNGSNAIFNGWFGDIHDDLNVTIGNTVCQIVEITNSTLICNSPPLPININQVVKIIQNSVLLQLNQVYKPIDPPHDLNNNNNNNNNQPQCINNCTSFGQGCCNTTLNECECFNNWAGYDCSFLKFHDLNNHSLPIPGITIDEKTAVLKIQVPEVNFQVSILKLLEIDIQNITIFEYPFNDNWLLLNSSSGSSGNQVFHFQHFIITKNSTINYSIEKLLNDKEVQFGNLTYNVESGSVTMSISIENYDYLSVSNRIQLHIKSIVFDGSGKTKKTIDSSLLDVGGGDRFSRVSIKSNNNDLNLRFINYALSDQKSTPITSQLLSTTNDNSSLIVGVNIQYFSQSSFINTDLTPLISVNTDEDSKSSINILLVVSIVVSIVFLSFLIGSALFIYKKYYLEAKLGKSIKKTFNNN